MHYSCPVCGLPESSDGEHFCGQCEEKFRTDELAWATEAYAQYISSIPSDGGDCGMLTFSEFCRELGVY